MLWYLYFALAEVRASSSLLSPLPGCCDQDQCRHHQDHQDYPPSSLERINQSTKMECGSSKMAQQIPRKITKILTAEGQKAAVLFQSKISSYRLTLYTRIVYVFRLKGDDRENEIEELKDVEAVFYNNRVASITILIAYSNIILVS